ncbi:GD20066 [Drosophila simulans]|uniref:GD20066 n=1 Tax=Drosophila simulans TaxID=7240 RepID=B4QS35_DROSI|nr:GD20066 [Drosophila simulans]
MTRFRIKNLKILSCCLSLWVVLFGGALHLAQGSEFPERECCDLTTTSTVGPLPMPPAALPTDKSLSSATTALETDLAIGRSVAVEDDEDDGCASLSCGPPDLSVCMSICLHACRFVSLSDCLSFCLSLGLAMT